MRKMFLGLAAVASLSACAADGLGRGQITEVNGFDVKVQRIDGDPPTYRATGATARDRAQLDRAYYARNVIGIRNVVGCPIKPELIRHEKDGPATVAGVVCS